MAPDSLRLSLHQIDVTVGDLGGNEARIRESLRAARAAGAHLAVFPELAVTGYPPEDLLLKPHFLRDARAAVERIAGDTGELAALVGFPEQAHEDVYNAAALLADGELKGIYRKVYLPNYGVFDEQRYFQAGRQPAVFDFGELRVGVTICEDVWEPGPPASEEALAGAILIVNLSASPYHAGKGVERERMFAQRARDSVSAYAFCNLVGGQDELVFDGHSLVVDHEGRVLARAEQFAEAQLLCEVDLAPAAAARLRDARHRPLARRTASDVRTLARLPAVTSHGEPPEPRVAPVREPLEDEVYAALTLGLRDYVVKNGFSHVVLGVSGGIDSALVACIGVDALGPDAVSAVVMPSPYSSDETRRDAHALLANLGLEPLELEILPGMEAYAQILAQPFAGLHEDITEENLQARIRGNLLMALSNKFGWLVLTTGNKSELSVGYSTLYGDLAGGFAVIKDVPKTLVYRLAEHHNRVARETTGHELIPESILARAPSAELRADQRDEDSLPPYSVLDRILQGYVELDLGAADLIDEGLPEDEVTRVVRLVDQAEYKRRQAPPGIKITPRAFGRDRRMPITNRYGG